MSKQIVENLLSVLERISSIIISDNGCYCVAGQYDCVNCSVRFAIKEAKDFLEQNTDNQEENIKPQFISHSNPDLTISQEDLNKFFPE